MNTSDSHNQRIANMTFASVYTMYLAKTGMICGYRIEDIENALTQKVRYLDKLVDVCRGGLRRGKRWRRFCMVYKMRMKIV